MIAICGKTTPEGKWHVLRDGWTLPGGNLLASCSTVGILHEKQELDLYDHKDELCSYCAKEQGIED